MTTLVVIKDGLIKLECKYCGKTVWRKVVRKDGAVCQRCRQDGINQRKREWTVARKYIKGSSVNTCKNCKYYSWCNRHVWDAVVIPKWGIAYMPLPCFAEHPNYDPAEWGRNGV